MAAVSSRPYSSSFEDAYNESWPCRCYGSCLQRCYPRVLDCWGIISFTVQRWFLLDTLKCTYKEISCFRLFTFPVSEMTYNVSSGTLNFTIPRVWLGVNPVDSNKLPSAFCPWRTSTSSEVPERRWCWSRRCNPAELMLFVFDSVHVSLHDDREQ